MANLVLDPIYTIQAEFEYGTKLVGLGVALTWYRGMKKYETVST